MGDDYFSEKEGGDDFFFQKKIRVETIFRPTFSKIRRRYQVNFDRSPMLKWKYLKCFVPPIFMEFHISFPLETKEFHITPLRNQGISYHPRLETREMFHTLVQNTQIG